MSKSKILFKMTGSIACYKACNIISKLVQNNFEVQVVASASALKFVGAATLEGLTGKPVVSDLWAQGNAMDHIHLIRWADLILVAPATANFINKTAQGVGDDLLTTLFLAHDFKKPYLIAPAMNTSMYLHPATQKSLAALKTYGVQILESASGVLACGETGYGKLLDPDLIFQELVKHLANPTTDYKAVASSAAKKILITAGGTQEPIDAVRSISNKSTGSTAAYLADHLLQLGFDVTYVHAKNAVLPQQDCEKISFVSFSDLSATLQKALASKTYAAVIQAAAISDFSVQSIESSGKTLSSGKISSEAENVNIHLKKNPKLINQLREMADNNNLYVVAFKMTAQSDPADWQMAVDKVFESARPQLVVHNDLSQINWQTGQHAFHLYKSKTTSLNLNSKAELAQELGQILTQELL